MAKHIDGLALFSGGLDSVLAARVLEAQGLSLACIHFTSPFFGKSVNQWRELYKLDIREIDISDLFAQMLASWPTHGVGKTLNPCLDCKILMLKKAKKLLDLYGAQFIATGEVKGQRPMSQREDAMNIILKATGLNGRLIRPLCASFFKPTIPEETGLIQRKLLPRIHGRGRNDQIELAKQLGIKDIPSPAGGCLLTERENARRYWTILNRYWAHRKEGAFSELSNDFKISNHGRTLFNMRNTAWLCIGRNQADNQSLASLRLPGDILLRLPFPGPLGLLRNFSDPEDIKEAGALLASYSSRAKNSPQVNIKIQQDNGTHILRCRASSFPHWCLPSWEDTHEQIKQERKRRLQILKEGARK